MQLHEKLICGFIMALFSSPFYLMLFVNPSAVHKSKQLSNGKAIKLLLIWLVLIEILAQFIFTH